MKTTLRPVRSPKLQIFVEMFRRNLQSLVWKRHVDVPPWYTFSDVTSKKAQNDEISNIFQQTLSYYDLCRAPP